MSRISFYKTELMTRVKPAKIRDYAMLAGDDPFTRLFFLLCIVLFLLSIIFPVLRDTGWKNLYVYQADAFLHGRLDIDKPLPDAALHNGKYYVPFPPMPAVLITPVLAIFGGVNTTLISVLLTILNVYLLWNILTAFKLDPRTTGYILIAFFLGTGYWSLVRGSVGVWHFAQIVAVTFILLSIRETLGRHRGWLAGILLGCAFLCRQLSIYSSIFIVGLLLMNTAQSTRNTKLKTLLGFGFSMCLMLAVYLLFNTARFGTPFDTGYTYLLGTEFGASRLAKYGLFNPAYIPFNFIYMFLQGPHFIFNSPTSTIPSGIDLFGTSLTFASPFVFASLWAKGNRVLIYSAWAAVLCSIIHMLLYFNNGWAQVNTQRFTLDFLPIIMILIALSVKYINRKILYAGIVYAVALNLITFHLTAILRHLSQIHF